MTSAAAGIGFSYDNFYPNNIGLGDYNNDGKLDFISLNNLFALIKLGDGLGNFNEGTQIDFRGNLTKPGSLAAGNVNGDGNLDLAISFNDSSVVSIFLGDGAGKIFDSGIATSAAVASSNILSMKFGDFNGDGKLDLAAVNFDTNTVSIRLGNGDGTFSGTTEVSVGANPQFVVLGDFDKDGKLDFATANQGNNNISIRLGNGDGTFSGAPDVGVGTNPRSMALGDFNGDGKLDFATSDNYYYTSCPSCIFGGVSIGLNSCVSTPPPVIVQQPLARAVCQNATVNLNVSATGTGTLSYQWKKDNVALSNGGTIQGATTAGLTISPAALSDAGSYTVDVTDVGGTTTSTAVSVVVNTSAVAPLITSQPTSQSVAIGETATFAVAGTNADTIQWQVSVNGGHFWTNIAGATATTYSMPVRPIYDGNRYRAVLTNCSGIANSNLALLTVTGTSPAASLTGLVIREFRLRGNASLPLDPAQDEYIEIHNVTPNNITVNNGGWAVAALASDGNSSTTIATIPDGTVIPTKGHYLLVNPNGYTLGALAAGDVTFTTDLPDDGGLALFNTTNAGSFNATTKIDAVGFQSAGTQAGLFREGTGLTNLGTTNGEYAWVRKMQNGQAVDTDNNANDFVLVNPAGGAINGVTAQLGTPGPANLSNTVEMNSQIIQSLFEPLMATAALPNQARDTTAVLNGAFGMLALRRTSTNNSGARLSKVRFRLIDITNAAAGSEANLRVLNSVTATIDGKTVAGLTLAPLPAQPNGGRLNSLLVLAPDLPIGATVNVEFKLGVMRKGQYRFILNIEAAP